MRATTLLRACALAATLTLGLTAAAAGVQAPDGSGPDDDPAVPVSAGRTLERGGDRGTREKERRERGPGASVQSPQGAPGAEADLEQEDETSAADTLESEDTAESDAGSEDEASGTDSGDPE